MPIIKPLTPEDLEQQLDYYIALRSFIDSHDFQFPHETEENEHPGMRRFEYIKNKVHLELDRIYRILKRYKVYDIEKI